jgi:centrosomal protein CEP350
VFKEEHETYLNKAAEILFTAHQTKADLTTLNPPDSFFGPRELTDDPDSVVRRCYVEMLFDLAKETAVERLTADNVAQRPSYMKPKLVTHRPWLVPKTLDELKSAVSRVGLRHLGFESAHTRDRFVVEWTKKRKDKVDRILVRELQSEESAWTDFEEEEVLIKNKLTNSLFDCLVGELCRELAVIRRKRPVQQSSNCSSSVLPFNPRVI